MKLEKVLVIEDNRDVSEMIAYAISQRGHEVIVRHNSVDGIAAFHHNGPFDLVLVNLGLENGDDDGFKVVEQLRKVDKTTTMWITSAFVDDARKIRGEKAGANKTVHSFDVLETLGAAGYAPPRDKSAIKG